MSETQPDPVTAYLDDVEKRYRVFGESDAMPALLDAIERVRLLAATWAGEPIPSSSHAGSVRAANVLRACGASLDQAIAAGLLGEGETDGH